MAIQKLQIVYETFKELVPKVPTYYVPQGTGGYLLCAVAEEFIALCRTVSGSSNTVNFETNYKSSGSMASSIDDALVLGGIKNGVPLVKKYQKDSAQPVVLVGREGKETIWATHNFADKTTWYGDSVRTSEGLSDSGNNLTFSGSHVNWIDLVHGKVFDEDAIAEDVPHGYSVIVVVDNVTQSARAAFSQAGGDYTVNYRSGSVTFFSPVTSSVTCSYSYENGSTWYLKPTTGRTLDIQDAEAQFAKNTFFNDTIIFAAYGAVQHFAPQYLIENGGPLPRDYMIPLETNKYKTFMQMVDEARGSYPTVPAISFNERTINSEIYGFPFVYSATRRMWNKKKMELRVSLENNTEFYGDRATATFYCISRDESLIDE